MNIRHIHLDKVDSTNNYLQCYKQSEDEDITFVWTDAQVAGRGCGANSWECEAGKNIAFSVLFHPVHVPASKQFIISMANALALKEALGCFTEGLTVKWPNDIYWKDFKLAGTLIEPSLRRGVVADCIIGTGINVNQTVFLSDAPNPVSLRMVTGREIPVGEVADRVVECLARRLGQVMRGEREEIVSLYHERLYRREGFHTYRDAEGCFSAAIRQVATDGHLQLCDTEGRLRSYAFKEVAFVL